MDKLGNRRRIAAISAASLLCAASTVSAAIPATFTRIVDTNTPMPEWTPQSPLVFGSFSAAALQNGSVAFAGGGGGNGPPPSGVYPSTGGNLDGVADGHPPIPARVCGRSP